MSQNIYEMIYKEIIKVVTYFQYYSVNNQEVRNVVVSQIKFNDLIHISNTIFLNESLNLLQKDLYFLVPIVVCIFDIVNDILQTIFLMSIHLFHG